MTISSRRAFRDVPFTPGLLRSLVTLFAILLSATGCTGPTDPGATDRPPCGALVTGGTMSATLDGTVVASSLNLWQVHGTYDCALSGAANSFFLEFRLPDSSGNLSVIVFPRSQVTGTHTVQPYLGYSPYNAEATVSGAYPLNWCASGSCEGSDGSVTVTSFTPTRATGRFEFNLVPRRPETTTGTRVIKDGMFDVTF